MNGLSTHLSFCSATVACLVAGPAHAQFSPANHPTGLAPLAIASARLDANASVDLATAHPSADAVFALLNNGSGTGFPAAPLFSYLPGSQPRELVVEDFDSSLRPDFAVVLGSGAIAIHLAVGAWPGYAPPVLLAMPGRPIEAVSLDVEQDGDRDLAVITESPATLTLLTNSGLGTFTVAPPIPLPAGFAPHSIAAGNLNGGGGEDLVVTGSIGIAQALVFVNQTPFGGAVAFAAPQPFWSDYRPFGVCTGDFDGNGIDDIAIDGAAFSTLTILLNTTPSFGSPTVSFAVSSQPLAPCAMSGPATEIECGDFDCDGLPDLAVTCTGSNGVGYLHNLGGGTFAAPILIPAPAAPGDIVVADLDGAPGLDLATANVASNDVSVLLNLLVPGCCEHFVIGGIGDGFALTTPPGPEEACPGPQLLAAFGGIPRRDFDGPVQSSRLFLHTFSNLPSGIKRMRLEMSVRADSVSSPGDVMGVGFDPAMGFSFSGTMANLTGLPFTFGFTAPLGFDLGDMPNGTNLLPKINADGRLDVFIRSNTAVDSIRLRIETCARSRRSMSLSVTPLVLPGTTDWIATTAPPSGFVVFLIGPSLGAGPSTAFGDLCITAPAVLGVAPTDPFGNSVLSLPFPAIPFPPCVFLSSQAAGLGSGGVGALSNTWTSAFFD